MALKFVMMIFVMIISGGQVNSLITIDRQDVGLCTKNTEMIWRFAWQYFKDMHAVAILGYQDDSLDFSNEIMKCSMKDYELSIQYNTSIWNITNGEEKRRLREGEVFYRHEMNGLIFIKETAENIKAVFPPIDQETKVVLILKNTSTDDINEVQRLAWNQYHILDLVIFYITYRKRILKNDVMDLYVSVYNPFIIKDNIRGHVQTAVMTSEVCQRCKLLKNLRARLINVHGYPLQILITGSMLHEIEKTKCEYPDCGITHSVIKSLNFTPVYHQKQDKGQWLEMQKGSFDMLPKILFLSYYGQYYTVFLYPIDFEGHTFLTPKIQPSSTVSFIKIFTPVVSLALALSYVAMVIAWRWLQKKHRELVKNNGKRMSSMEICCVIFGNFLLMPQPGGADRYYERCLFITWVSFSMIICFSYQGTMVKHLTAGGPSRDINTMRELAESDLKILFTRPQKELIQDATDKGSRQYFKQLLERSQVILLDNYDKSVQRVAEDRNVAVMCNYKLCRTSHLKFYTTKTGLNEIHIMKEELFGSFASLAVPLDSPYKERFNGILMKILESGLIQKWERNYDNSLKRQHLMPRVYNQEPRNDIYRMKDLCFIFWSWFACCGFCCLIFLGELFWVYICKIMQEVSITFLNTFKR